MNEELMLLLFWAISNTSSALDMHYLPYPTCFIILCHLQWPHVPTTTVPGWQGEAFTHNKQVNFTKSNIVIVMLELHHRNPPTSKVDQWSPRLELHWRLQPRASRCDTCSTSSIRCFISFRVLRSISFFQPPGWVNDVREEILRRWFFYIP